MTGLRARAAEAALVALTLLAVLSAREPAEGAEFRWGFVLASFAAAGLAVWYATHATPSRRRVLVMAVALRAIAFPLPPALSDDAYRYVWDGIVQARGDNPYRFRPDAPGLADLQGDEVFDRLNSAGYYSVYPPASQLAFLAGAPAYSVGWQGAYYAIKALITIADVAAVALLLRLAPAASVVLYAWSPLAVLEIAGQGHTEGIAVLGIVLGAWGVARRRGWWAGMGLALAGGAKLLPLALVPLAWRRAGAAVPLAAGAMCLAMAAPYVAPYAGAHFAESLGLYVRSFEFAAGPYLTLKSLARALGLGDVSKALGPVLGVLFVAGYAGLVWADRRNSWSFATVSSAVYGLFFVTATTVHPWYLVPALALAPLLRRPGAWLWAAALAPATYLFYTGPAWAYTGAVILGWGGALALGAREPLADWLLRRRARWKWRWIESALGGPPEGLSILDLGAAEGYVGECAAAAGAQVTLADIVDANRTGLGHLTFDGETLPLADATTDVVLLVFVLHHARDPDRLLSEAARVGGRLVILESVPEERRRGRTEALDRFANRLRPRSLRDDERWLRMRSAEEWRRRIEAAGLEIVVERRRGRVLHPQALFVTRRRGAPSSDTRSAGAAT